MTDTPDLHTVVADELEPPASRLAAAAVLAAMTVSAELGVTLSEMTVLCRIEEEVDGAPRNSIVSWPPDREKMINAMWYGLRFALRQMGYDLSIDLADMKRKHTRPMLSGRPAPRRRPTGRSGRRGR